MEKVKEVDKKALEEKVKEENIMKDAHAIDFFATVVEYPIVDEYEVPTSYNIDTIVLMPVNAEKLYVYWEITDSLIKKKLNNGIPGELTIKLFEVNLGAPKKKQEKEIYSFSSPDKVGSNYVDYPSALRPMMAKIGVLIDNQFVEILKSKPVSIPSYEVLGPDDSLWTRTVKDLPKSQAIKKVEKKIETKKEEAVKELEVVKQILRVRTKDTDILNVFMGLLEKLKDATDRKAKVMELLQGFVDVRTKDIELLWLFLDLIEQTRQIHSAKEAETIIEHFQKIQEKTEEESEASSEILHKQVNV